MTPQQPIKGFRPGKEPPRLKKQQAKQRFGELSRTQEQLVELFAERTPAQSRALIRRWLIGLLVATLVMALAAVGLALWSWIAGAVVGVLAVALLILWFRLRSQREAFEAMADTVAGRR